MEGVGNATTFGDTIGSFLRTRRLRANDGAEDVRANIHRIGLIEQRRDLEELRRRNRLRARGSENRAKAI